MNSAETNARERLIIALDLPDAAAALEMVQTLAGEITTFKIGLQLFTAAGPEIVRAVRATGAAVFLDLKLHDIPNTVAKAVQAAAALEVRMLTVHLSGGRQMLEAAVAAAPAGLLILGVTVLTSSDAGTLRETGIISSVADQAICLAALGKKAGIGGLIASPQEIGILRSEVGPAMKIITPGVRPGGAAADDQKRFTTPREALENGADFLVIGRPVTAQDDPREAVRRIVREIAA